MLLRNLTRRAVVIVTHEPEAAAIADRVLHLQDGRLILDSDRDGGTFGPGPAGAIRSPGS
jgi:ABC-type lipoprotein export system ATPase subunit